MIKYTISLLFFIISIQCFSQSNNCSGAVSGCSTPGFTIEPPNTVTDILDFGTGTISNPSTNPNASPGNSGCLLTGETSSTFITISIVTSGTLAWSIQGATAGCFDWIMWPYNSTTCTSILAGTLPPVACCWNGACGGFTGMCPPGALPVGADQTDFENSFNVNAGESYLLCLSNFSGTSQNVDLNFFGTCQVTCGVDAADQIICLGSSATVNINTTAIANPTFNWLETNNVSNPTSGTNVIVTPSFTTTYHVVVTDNSTVPVYIDTAVFTITVVNPSVPNAGLNDTVCLGSTIQLTGTLSDLTDTYSWSSLVINVNPVPTITIASNNLSPTATVNQPGLYAFILSESNVTCPIETDTVFVLVSSTSQTISFLNPTCNGSSDGSITINNPNGVLYSFDNGVTWGGNSTLNTFSSGTYTVCSKNLEGCQICSDVVLVDPLGVNITASNDTVICQNGTAFLQAQASGGNNFNYTWSQTSNSTNSQSYSPVITTVYEVFVSNEYGCYSDTLQIQVTVKDPIVGTISPNQSICSGITADIVASAIGGQGIYQFTWNTPQIDNGINSTISVQPISSRIYTVQIEDDCESTPVILSTNVDLYNNPEPTFIVLEDSICEPAIFTITNTTNPNSVGSISWVISNGLIVNNQETVQTPKLNEGYYDVKLIVTSPDGCVDSITKLNALISIPFPMPSFSYSPNPVKIFDTKVSFSNTSFNSDSFEWFIENGSPAYANTENATTNFPEGVAASYRVTLVATSDFGCIDSSVVYVNVLPEVIFYAPTAFTPNGDEFNQTWKIVIDGIDIFDFDLLVYNRWGEIVWETKDPNDFWDGTYNGKKVEDGTYNWLLETKDKFSDERYRFNGSFNVIK